MQKQPKRKPGRQPVGKPKRQVLVAVEEELIDECLKIGEGNLSAGVRLYLALASTALKVLPEGDRWALIFMAKRFSL